MATVAATISPSMMMGQIQPRAGLIPALTARSVRAAKDRMNAPAAMTMVVAKPVATIGRDSGVPLRAGADELKMTPFSGFVGWVHVCGFVPRAPRTRPGVNWPGDRLTQGSWLPVSQNSSRPPLRGAVTTYVYRFFRGDGTLLYVGVTKNLESRFGAHQNKPWWPQASHSTVDAHGNRALALAAEAIAILEENPLYNIHRPTRARAATLQARALGEPAVENSPYDPVAILARAHGRIESLEADLAIVRKALTSVSLERDQLAAAARTAASRPSPTQQTVDKLREELRRCKAEMKLAEARAERAEHRLKTASLKRIVAASRPNRSAK
jgi:hypothetical protein